jgi:hypothetical protein
MEDILVVIVERMFWTSGDASVRCRVAWTFAGAAEIFWVILAGRVDWINEKSGLEGLVGGDP